METINLELKELDHSSFYPVTLLEVSEKQKECVASNAFSMAQANFHSDAWFRGIFVNDEAVGFVMLKLDHDKPDYYLWRLMIDRNHQGKGYGKLALDKIVEFLGQFPEAKVLRSSVDMGEASPLNFYLNYGFKETDEWDNGEKVIRLKLK
ncbi:MAG: GNAT family N-acetyltransferase [Spirochaetales bacterium]|nr:GNAT family N-acetyltransferase [Spirochaetales bacterium]